jgi:hypothetical protein
MCAYPACSRAAPRYLPQAEAAAAEQWSLLLEGQQGVGVEGTKSRADEDVAGALKAAGRAGDGGLQRCGRCRRVAYCDGVCQRLAWKGPKGHKKVCVPQPSKQ